MKFPSSPFWLTVITGTCIIEWNICCGLNGCCFFFLFRLPKMNDRWWNRCMTGIAWSSRSSPEPTPSLSLWVEHSFGGCSFWLWAEETGISTLLHTMQSLRPSPNLPYHSVIKEMNEWMTHRILKSGKAGQGTLVPTHEPWGTSHLVLFLLFPLGCCCYFIILCLATASLPFAYQSTL